MSRSSSRFVVVLLLLLPVRAALAQAPVPHDSATVASVEQLFAVTNVAEQMAQQQEAMLAGMLRTTPGLEPLADTMREFFARRLSFAQLKDEMVQLYRGTFTEAEVQSAVAYFGSGAGSAFVRKQPALAQAASELAIRRTQAFLPELRKMIEERGNSAP